MEDADGRKLSIPEREMAARIEALESELKWLQNQHVRVCSSESKLREAAQAVVGGVTFANLKALAALLEEK